MLVCLRVCLCECVFVPISTFERLGTSFQSNTLVLISYKQQQQDGGHAKF